MFVVDLLCDCFILFVGFWVEYWIDFEFVSEFVIDCLSGDSMLFVIWCDEGVGLLF